MDTNLLLFIPLLIAVLGFVALVDILQVALGGIRSENLEKLVQRNVGNARRLEKLVHDTSAPMGLALAQLKTLAVVITIILTIGAVASTALTVLPSVLIGGLFGGAILLVLQGVAHVIAAPRPERTALRLVGAASALATIARPFTRLTGALRPAPLVVGDNGFAQDHVEEAAEDNPPTDDNASDYEVEEREREMIRSILQLDDTAVREIMVPRPDITAVDQSTPLPDVIDLIQRTGVSRVPVYDGNIDNIVGVIYAKDLLPMLRLPGGESLKITDIARKPFLIPETKKLDELLRDFQDKRVHLGIVVDEYGGVAGLVTIEDLLEEIVGEIEDEYDKREPEVLRVSDDEVIIDAKAPIYLLNELFSTEIEGEGFDTVGGLVYSQLGRVPLPGDTVEMDGIKVDVLTTSGRRIRKVRVQRRSTVQSGAE